MDKKNLSFIKYIGCIICLSIIIFDTNIRPLTIICSIGIGMQIMLIIDEFQKVNNKK